LLLAVLGLVALTLLVDPISTAGERARDVASVTGYDVAYVLDADGTLAVDETIEVSFPVPRHGIFRIFDTAAVRGGPEHPVELEQVRRDGGDEPWAWVPSAPGTETARIGDEDVFVGPGTTTYRLQSSTRDVVEPKVVEGEEDPDTSWWWWDVVGEGWQMPMDDVTVRATLPVEPTDVDCVIGESTPCEPVVAGREVTLALARLEPFEAVTMRVSMPSSAVPANSAGSDALGIALAVLAGVVGAALALAGTVATRERAPGFPVLFEPPEGIRPAVGARVLDERPSEAELQATLFDLGERGVVRVESNGETWVVEVVGATGPESCAPWEAAALAGLGLRHPGDRFTVSNTVAAGRQIASARETLEAGLHAEVRRYLTPSVAGVLLRLGAWAGLAALAVIAGLHLFADRTAPVWVTVGIAGFVAVAALRATDPGTATTRSREGREVWSRTGGFARFLSTDSSESRFDAAAHMDWYPRYLPWAVALGVSGEWTRRYRAQGIEDPDVPYVTGWGYYAGRGGFSSFDDSFNSAIGSAGAAYAASQAASSGGGGGGFSGGSGGGGGGGGSW
jgi:hypothetical protein